MKARKPIDWRRVGQLTFIAVSIGTALAVCAPITGIMGHMILAVLDSAFASHLSPMAPYVPWAVAGAMIGVGPALWSFSSIRKRRSLVLWAPLAVVVIVGSVASILVGLPPTR